MWISRDYHGNIELWDRKPSFDSFTGRVVNSGDGYELRKVKKIVSNLRRGETRKVKSIKIELED